MLKITKGWCAEFKEDTAEGEWIAKMLQQETLVEVMAGRKQVYEFSTSYKN